MLLDVTDRSPVVDGSCGQATTLVGGEATDADPGGLQPARAIRRALAAARRKAFEVDAVWATFGSVTPEDADAWVRGMIALALGRDPDRLRLEITSAANERALEDCAALARAAVAGRGCRVALAVAIGLGGQNVALAFCSE